jgi:hypothetical protein
MQAVTLCEGPSEPHRLDGVALQQPDQLGAYGSASARVIHG